jgi:hypothetical protein
MSRRCSLASGRDAHMMSRRCTKRCKNRFRKHMKDFYAKYPEYLKKTRVDRAYHCFRRLDHVGGMYWLKKSGADDGFVCEAQGYAAALRVVGNTVEATGYRDALSRGLFGQRVSGVKVEARRDASGKLYPHAVNS